VRAPRTFIMQKLLGFTVRRAGTSPCVLSREKGVATYFADSHLLVCVAVLLLLRQDFLLLGFGGGALKRLLRLANVCIGSEGDTLARAMDFAHYSVFFPCALSAWTLTPEPLTCKLHEGIGNQGVLGEAVGLIGRKSIALAMVSGGSAQM